MPAPPLTPGLAPNQHLALSQDLAEACARVALGHVGREYPNKLEHVTAGPGDHAEPRTLHPVFYGSFDWHSCVHGYWMLARLLHTRPTLAAAEAIRHLFAEQFVPDKIAVECAYLDRPTARGFERPYGWAWILKLAAELMQLDDPRAGLAMAPLAHKFADRFRAFLPGAVYPVRVGTHFNTAFALRLAADYAAVTKDAPFLALLRETASRWYGEDRACPAWGEPSGDDFLSSCLAEAECMRALLPPEAFAPWFERFLPALDGREPTTLFRPAVVSDRSDGKTAHLDGLNLSRAWCWRALAGSLPQSDPRRDIMLGAAAAHIQASLKHISGDYMGEHWLATFAVLALDEEA